MIRIILGDVRESLAVLPDSCIQCCVTSPPYFRLRSYLDADDPNKTLEIGQENTVGDYVANMVHIFQGIRRVLHPTGVAFLNLGDGYSKGGLVPEKSLLMVPSRVALALQDDGWYLRSHIAWTKNNPMPDSAKGRPTPSWESVFVLTKHDRYYWDYEGAKEEAVSTIGSGNKARKTVGQDSAPDGKAFAGGVPWQPNGTRNMRNVWPINTQSFAGAHFAVFPPEIPRRAIQAATSDGGCCPSCRTPYRRIIEKGEADLEHQRLCGGDTTGGYDGQAVKNYASNGAQNASDVKRRILAGMVKKTTIGWEPMCKCPPAPPVPCIVLDPFGGSGTTGMVAHQMQRDAVLVDLNQKYLPIMLDRIKQGK